MFIFPILFLLTPAYAITVTPDGMLFNLTNSTITPRGLTNNGTMWIVSGVTSPYTFYIFNSTGYNVANFSNTSLLNYAHAVSTSGDGYYYTGQSQSSRVNLLNGTFWFVNETAVADSNVYGVFADSNYIWYTSSNIIKKMFRNGTFIENSPVLMTSMKGICVSNNYRVISDYTNSNLTIFDSNWNKILTYHSSYTDIEDVWCNSTNIYLLAGDNKTIEKFNWSTSLSPTSTTLYLNGSDRNKTGSYGLTVNATATCNVTSFVELYRNGTLINNQSNIATDITVLKASVWNYTAKCIGNSSLASSNATFWFEINKSIPSESISFNTSDNIISGTPCQIGCSGTTPLAWLLYDSISAISNPTSLDTSAMSGIYAFYCNATGNENYTDSPTAVRTLTISAVPPEEPLTAGDTYLSNPIIIILLFIGIGIGLYKEFKKRK
jgi:hypothetical protein